MVPPTQQIGQGRRIFQVLAAVFAGMCLYGIYVGTYGAAFFSLLMSVFILWAEKKMREQDQRWLDQQIYQAQDTEQVLADKATEASNTYRHW
jgi:hypothetical protein